MKWNNIHDIQNYIFNQNNEHTFERQQIKFIGNFGTDVNINLDEMNLSKHFSLDVSIGPVIHIMIPKEEVYVDGKLHIVEDVFDRSCRIFPSVEKCFSCSNNS